MATKIENVSGPPEPVVWLNADECAGRYQVSPSTWYRWNAQGLIPRGMAVGKPGGKVGWRRWRLQDLKIWEASGGTQLTAVAEQDIT